MGDIIIFFIIYSDIYHMIIEANLSRSLLTAAALM